jgi:hypothetical protein
MEMAELRFTPGVWLRGEVKGGGVLRREHTENKEVPQNSSWAAER